MPQEQLHAARFPCTFVMFLAPAAADLVLGISGTPCAGDSVCDGLLDVSHFSTLAILGVIRPVAETTNDDLLACAIKLRGAALAAFDYFSSLSFDDFVTKHSSQCTLAPPGRIEEVFRWYCEGDTFGALGAAATLCERALGDVYVARAPPGTRIPTAFSLRDLLKDDIMTHAIGEDNLFVLRSCLGMPSGLNLRNLYWHGFVDDVQLPAAYTCLLLSLMLTLDTSVGKILQSSGMRRPLAFTHAKSEWLLWSPCLHHDFSEADIAMCSLLFERSPFVVTGRAHLFTRALHFFVQGKDYNSAVLLLPQVEHCLRVLFAEVNHAPPSAVIADPGALFTTLDVVLSTTMPDGAANELFRTLGAGCLEALYDLMFENDGPRLRDRLSHGEASIPDCPRPLIAFLWSIVLYLICRRDVPEPLPHHPLLSDCCSFVKHYQARFHPYTLASCALDAVVEDWKALVALADRHQLLSWHNHIAPTVVTVTDPASDPASGSAAVTAAPSDLENTSALDTAGVGAALHFAAVPPTIVSCTNDSSCVGCQQSRRLAQTLPDDAVTAVLAAVRTKAPEWLRSVAERAATSLKSSSEWVFDLRADSVDDRVAVAHSLCRSLGYVRSSIMQVLQRAAQLQLMVETRTARTSHRKNYANLHELLPGMCCGIMFLVAVYRQTFLTKRSGDRFLSAGETVAERLLSIMRENQWLKVNTVLEQFVPVLNKLGFKWP
eukprot:TRINITY_DN11383_c0_g1_i1.p1 TRINITY_DN11383_c0_g1~~TRINITY_DN11383_c0_g1_i1.p1  ORF type:complete len:717 (-),score=157.00 TRINITY_DN11383_c0_g1_i1:514-2664(-)